jgi:hypothetical protein
MESSVGYSEGQGTRIATHKILEKGEQLHHQRFAAGTGQLNLMQVYPPTTTTPTPIMVDCAGAGRIIIAAQASVDGLSYKIVFFDKNLMPLGQSDEILIEEESDLLMFVNEFIESEWTASKLYNPNHIIKIAANNHAFMNITTDVDGNYIGGLAGTTEPTWPLDGSTIVDNQITWKDLGDVSSLKTTPLTVFSNSMGASYFMIVTTTINGTIGFFADAI